MIPFARPLRSAASPLLVVPAALAALSLAAQDPDPRLAEINDAAAFLAGEIPPHRADHPLTATADWTAHVARFGADFSDHLARVLVPMSEWSAAELGPSRPPADTVRYFFSGPDILHAYHLFPEAETFILCGLEPVGVAPDISALNQGNVSRALAEVRNALGEILQLSFFRTKDMKEDLAFATFRGTTPLMMIFLAKSGQYVRELEFLTLQKDGSLASRGLDPNGANVVRLVFSPRRLDRPKTLYYFSTDLSNGGFDSTGFGAWIARQPVGSSYLKAASFLMHDDWFSKVRDHLLAHSSQIVEDDSGIPFRRFDPALWETTLYGVYTGPIDLFKDAYQADLVAAYRGGSRPLPFGTGYKWRPGQSNLMRFVRKPLVAVPLAVPLADPPAIPRAEGAAAELPPEVELNPASSRDSRTPSRETASPSAR